MTEKTNIIEKFADLKNRKPEAVGETTESIMLTVFKAYPNTPFTQADFASRLNKRTQMINQILRGMLEKDLLIRTGSARQYYYLLKHGK